MSTEAPVPSDVYESFTGSQITDDMIQAAATLFSSHYGTWKGSGKRVRMSPAKLRAELLPSEHIAQCSYVRAIVDGDYVGHAFACEWLSRGRPILWITQLVVHAHFRSKGIAKSMLKKLERCHIYGYGIVSSHAHAIMAATTAFGRGPEGKPHILPYIREQHAKVRAQQALNFIKEHAVTVMKRSPIRYIREAEVHGTLFEDAGDNVSTIDTKFLVDHAEPEEALRLVKEVGREWHLGSLPEGHEFLVFIMPRYCRRSVQPALS